MKTNKIDFSSYDFSQIIHLFNLSDYMQDQDEKLQNLWESGDLARMNRLSLYFDEIGESFEQFLDFAANYIATDKGDDWASVHPLNEVCEEIREYLAQTYTPTDTPTDQPHDQDTDRVRFNIYAGYYELYLTTGGLPAPYMWQAAFYDIDDALLYMEFEDPEATIYCTDTREYLPDYMVEILDEQEQNGRVSWYDADKMNF